MLGHRYLGSVLGYGTVVIKSYETDKVYAQRRPEKGAKGSEIDMVVK